MIGDMLDNIYGGSLYDVIKKIIVLLYPVMDLEASEAC